MNAFATLLKQGVDHHQAGNFEEAEACYRKVLENLPENADALNLLGLIFLQKKNHAKSIELVQKAISINPSRADYFYNLGIALSEIGEWKQALRAYTIAADLDHSYAEPYVNMGVIFQKHKIYDSAKQMFEKAIERKVDFFDAFYNLGNLCYEMGDENGAIENLRKAIRLKPAHKDALFNLAVILRKAEILDESEMYLATIIAHYPAHVEAHFQMGLIKYNQGNKEGAFLYFKKTVDLNSDHLQALNNIGNLLQEKGDYDGAIFIYKKALALSPTDPLTLFNLGTACQFRGYIQEAFDWFERSLVFSPENPSAIFARGETRLMMGDFKEGFKDYEARFQVEKWKHKYPTLQGAVRWNGRMDELLGKTILVKGEQGYGDTIQFARYLPMIKALGSSVIFEVKKEVIGLFENFPGVDKLVLKSSSTMDLVENDCYTYLLSLPHYFKTSPASIPPVVPFRFDRSKRKNILPKADKKDKIGVGIVWSGNPSHLNDLNRSCPFSYFSSIFDMGGIIFYSLQKGESAQSLYSLKNMGHVKDLSNQLTDFVDTAMVIESLDLLITVDTSVAHLSGNMGIETWLLLPYSADFRWLLGRETSPWYPSLRLFRQYSQGDWSELFSRLRSALTVFVEERRAGGEISARE